MKTTTIDHTTRNKLGISSVHYIIADACAQHKNVWQVVTINSLSTLLGLSPRAVSVAVEEMRLSEPPLLEIAENGSIYPTVHWYSSFFEDVDKITTVDAKLAQNIVELFNSINSSKYLIPNNAELVKNILRQHPRLTIDHFRSVIVHKKESWGSDEKMSEYNRPATIFRSSKQFLKYLDEANMYWHNKQKHDTTAQTIRD